jgi:hypothetical protein
MGNKIALIYRRHDCLCRKSKGIYKKKYEINEFSKVTEYNINTLKYIVFVYAINKHVKIKFKK